MSPRTGWRKNLDLAAIAGLLLLASTAIGAYVKIKCDIVAAETAQEQIIKRLDRIEDKLDAVLGRLPPAP